MWNHLLLMLAVMIHQRHHEERRTLHHDPRFSSRHAWTPSSSRVASKWSCDSCYSEVHQRSNKVHSPERNLEHNIRSIISQLLLLRQSLFYSSLLHHQPAQQASERQQTICPLLEASASRIVVKYLPLSLLQLFFISRTLYQPFFLLAKFRQKRKKNRTSIFKLVAKFG